MGDSFEEEGPDDAAAVVVEVSVGGVLVAVVRWDVGYCVSVTECDLREALRCLRLWDLLPMPDESASDVGGEDRSGIDAAYSKRVLHVDIQRTELPPGVTSV